MGKVNIFPQKKLSRKKVHTFKTHGLSMKKTSKQKKKIINFCKDSCPDFGSSFLKKGAVGLTQNLEKK